MPERAGIGTVLACIAAIAARIAPLKHRNFAVGVLQAGYPIGAMITGFIAAWAIYDLERSRVLVIALGVVMALLVIGRIYSIKARNRYED